MANVFSERADLILRAALVLVLLGLAAATAGFFVLGNWRIRPSMGFAPPQPVMFSHEHHVGRLGLDCRYCHANTQESDFAGMPSAETCMNCHLQLYTSAPMLQPVRDAWASGTPVAWRRVYIVPDFIRFSHKVHVDNGVACVSCHGQMDEQPLTRLSTPLTMGWCLDCHRHPDSNLVAPQDVFSLTSAAAPGKRTLARVDRRELLTNCSACHY
jgi:hypothetical protein